MSLLETLRKRSSANAFSGDEISEGQLKLILEGAAYSPRAGNLQHFSIRVLNTKDDLNVLSKLMFDEAHVTNASAVLVFFVDLKTTETLFSDEKAEYPFKNLVGYHYGLADSLLALQNCALIAEDLGLATRVLSAPLLRAKAIAIAFECPVGVSPAFALALGYETKPNAPRFNLNWTKFTKFGFRAAWPTSNEIYDRNQANRLSEHDFVTSKLMGSEERSFARILGQFNIERRISRIFRRIY